MATLPQADFFGDGQPCLSCYHDCDGDQSTVKVRSFQGGNRQPDHSEMKETEDMLAAEMNNLSVEERSKALDDVHCVGDEVEETPELIEQSLREFEQIVQTTSDPIYHVAVKQNRSYVEDSSFRLKFLRKNLFDVRKSVNQMMNFLRQKALYFGEEKVAQDIVPADMNKEEIELMRTGFMQILTDRDQSGRVILYASPFCRVPAGCKLETVIHVLYHIYFNMVVPIPSVQKKGVVMIYYDESKGESLQFPPRLAFLTKVNSFTDALPLRLSSSHLYFYSSPGSLSLHNKMFQVVLKPFSEHALTRTRLRYGSDLERQYQLRSFGIPLDNFPVDKNGDVRTDFQMPWCDRYLENVTLTIDEQASNRNGALHHNLTNAILETDVLLGRGRPLQFHAGNVRFRKFLQARAEVYDGLPRNQRLVARIRYTQELISSGTRFMRQTETDLWVECEFDQALDKVAQFFRTRRHSRRQRETWK